MVSNSSTVDSFESKVILVAAVLQGMAATIAIIDYITERASDLIGVTSVYHLVISISGLAVLSGFVLLLFRKNELSHTQKNLTSLVIFIGVSVILLFSGMRIGEQRQTDALTDAMHTSDLPFLILQTFDFEGGLEGWSLYDGSTPTTITIEHQPEEAYTGTGYVRLRTQLPGRESGGPIELSESVYFWNTETNSIQQLDAVIAYVKIAASEQTIDNQFYVELQVRAGYGNEMRWSKTRYTVPAGRWVPIVWTKPSSIQIDESDIFFSGQANAVALLIWSSKPYTGIINVDNIEFFVIKR